MTKAAKNVQLDVFPSLIELASLMRDDPSAIDRETLRRGGDLLAIYEDINFKNSFQDLRNQKIAALGHAARDISEGGIILRSSVIGVTFKEGKMVPFVTPHGSSPTGSLAFSISWLQRRAFQNWRSDAGGETEQEDVNAALYRLAVCLSTILPPRSQ